MEDAEGTCPIRDLAPDLLRTNEAAAAIFQQARLSSDQYTTESSAGYQTQYFVRAVEIAALMDMHGIPAEDRPMTMDRIHVLQSVANKYGPRQKKK